jgi:type IV secretory pathway VirB4 component
MRQSDQQGKDEKKTYFSTDMRKFSKQDEGRAAVMALAQTEHQGSLTFFPVTGTMNKYWGVIDKLLTRDQVANLLKKANKNSGRG